MGASTGPSILISVCELLILERLRAYISVLALELPEIINAVKEQAEKYRKELVETAVEQDENLMEK